MDHQISYCRSCEAPIVWMKTRQGNNIPVDPDDIDPDDEVFDYQKHTTHFATCPNANRHRQ